MQRRCRIFPRAVRRYCDGVLHALAIPDHILTVVFVSDNRIRALNRMYRGRDRATDVLSFGYPGETVEGALFLGEIVIAPEIARREAVRRRTTTAKEVRRLLVHGILHLLGYDHEADAGEMNALQRRLLRRRIPGASEVLAEPNGGT
jgi:probable rRNA maturation factor